MMKKIYVLYLCIFLWSSIPLLSETAMEIPVTDNPPVIDGKLDDPVWNNAVKFQGFKTIKPAYGNPASQESTFFLVSDSHNIYFAADCRDTQPDKIKASITKRDNIFDDDWISLVLDTFNDYQTSFSFLVNPLGIQGDGMMNKDGNLNGTIDFVWFSKGEKNPHGYTVEARIPLSSIRFPSGKKTKMRLMIIRNIPRTTENAVFPEVSPNKGALLAQSYPIVFSDLKYKRVIELLPAFTHSIKYSDFQGQIKRDSRESELSFTAKLGLTQDLILDATINPDFSQVESDAGQVDVNLRYALFYDEKRPFFLEGSDVFDFAGNTEDAMLYSIVHTRNIADPVFGFKLAGKLTPKLTIASIYAKDKVPLDSSESSNDDKADFMIFRFRHALKGTSYFGGFYTGRVFQKGYNHVAGLDGHIQLSGPAAIEYHAIGSFSKDNYSLEKHNGTATAIRFNYFTRHFVLDTGIQDISKYFITETGFLNANDVTRVGILALYRYYPKSKFLKRIEPFYWSYFLLDKKSDLLEFFNLITFRFTMIHQTQIRFDFINGREVFYGERFNRNSIGFQLSSQLSKKFSSYIFFRYGNRVYYDPNFPFQGKGLTFSVDLTYQPTEKIDNGTSLQYVSFYRSSPSEKIYDYTILRNRLTFQFNKYLFFRGIAEYNFYYKQMQLDFLASFTYIPGTVIHLGYGSIFNKVKWDSGLEDYIESNRFKEIKRGLFFKISYLWRL